MASFSMRNLSQEIVPGGAMRITGPDGFEVTVSDGGNLDQSPGLNGIIRYTVPKAGLYSLCELVPPPGHASATPSCTPVQLDWGTSYVRVVPHTPLVEGGYGYPG